MARTSLKRRDNQDRILNKGEYQRTNGVYEYRYKDVFGKTRIIYSWRLTASDKLPKGKTPCKPLREMIADIAEDAKQNIDTYTAKSTTLNERFDLYMESKYDLRRSTKENYMYMYDKYVRKSIGRMKMSDFNYSILLQFYSNLIRKHGFMPNSLNNIHTLLNPVFEVAVWDKLVPTNECSRVMKTIRKSQKTKSAKKPSLTMEQQKVFMNFVESSETYRHWSNIFTVLLGTGMRISECLGLTWSNCDFNEGFIEVTHTLQYRKQEDGRCQHYVEPVPKTEAGEREIPMFEEVRAALLDEKTRQDKIGTMNTVIDGVSGWCFTNRYGTVYKDSSINDAIERIRNAYNRQEKIDSKNEGREPFLLPHFSCHQFRHTFCSRLCEVEGRVKVSQAIMGHKNIDTTVNIKNPYEQLKVSKQLDFVYSGRTIFRPAAVMF